MSNNLVSQPLMVPNTQIDHTPNQLESPMSTGMTGGMSGSPMLHRFDTPNKQLGVDQPIPKNFGYYNPLLPNWHMAHKDMQMSNQSPKILLPIKRTANGEHIIGNSLGQQIMTSDENFSPITNKPATQPQASKPGPNKKMTKNTPISGKSGNKQVQTPKGQTMQMEPSPKNKSESFESVRSKMRESLASALALVTEQQGKSSKEDIITSCNSVDNTEKNEESGPEQNIFERQIVSSQSISSTDVKNNEPEFQYVTSALAGEEVPFADSFFVQDELLQGNGLTWAMDISLDVGEANIPLAVEDSKKVEITKNPKLVQENTSKAGKVEVLPCPQILATKIEAELFKLFGGVNKKYKEKGRSLLFNLKDHNNPELRVRVMSGEISPERLCAMSAEELASKELSEWRTAKAEELAQMVVLPDSDVDIRRLVRKTHKGEFQVEVEQDDGVSVEVSAGTSVISRPRREKSEKRGSDSSAKVDKVNGKDNKVVSCSLTIPSDVVETDFMQGLMVDEFKDPDFLPPIVSLDEFMQSLDTEPPFENLHVEDEKIDVPSDKENVECQDQMTPTDEASKEDLSESGEKSDKVDAENVDSDIKTKENLSPPGDVLVGERVWEGLLQLSISGGVNAVGLFRSGEKTLTKEWPPLLEIKGRVKLDPFEKFISDLPMSRSRAVMLAHFTLKEGSSDADHAALEEAVHSYVLDERLGFAEPISGSVEIYFCPPHPKILEMLRKHLFKFYTDAINSIKKGLIGVIVWRKPHIKSTISPNSSSHHKHSKNSHHLTPTTSANVSNNIPNVKFAPHQRAPPPPIIRPPPHQFNDEDDGDIPPGFGPAPPRARDEDDLPEFSFSHKQNVLNSRPVDQMRELVLKYGQTGNNISNNNNNSNNRVGVKRWNDDDEDDDILPEWQPGQQLPNPQQSWVSLQANNVVPRGGRWVNQVPPGTQGERQNPRANIDSHVYGVQRYPRNRGF